VQAVADRSDVDRDQHAALRWLLALSLRLTQQEDQGRILQLVATAAESLDACQTEGILLDQAWQDIGRRGHGLLPAEVASAAGSGRGGRIIRAGVPWAWAYPIPASHGRAGYLVVGADQAPAEGDQFLLRSLAQHAGVALARARLHARERAQAAGSRARPASSVALARVSGTALGTSVAVPTPGGEAKVKVPPGTSSGRRLRLRGRGLPNPKGKPGDLLAEARIMVPPRPSNAERELFEQLAAASDFDPRGRQ
jgi:hypothetical protein